MTKKRIAQLRKLAGPRLGGGWDFIHLMLDEIERLQSERDTLNRALVKQTKIAAKLRQGAK